MCKGLRTRFSIQRSAVTYQILRESFTSYRSIIPATLRHVTYCNFVDLSTPFADRRLTGSACDKKRVRPSVHLNFDGLKTIQVALQATTYLPDEDLESWQMQVRWFGQSTARWITDARKHPSPSSLRRVDANLVLIFVCRSRRQVQHDSWEMDSGVGRLGGWIWAATGLLIALGPRRSLFGVRKWLWTPGGEKLINQALRYLPKSDFSRYLDYRETM